MEKQELISQWKGGLIVSVQADEGSPLNRPDFIAALAQAVAVPGVVGLRLNAPENIQAVRAVVELPLIGIAKTYAEDGRVWITPDFSHARALAEAGADVIALDATRRLRPPGEAVEEIIENIHLRLGIPVMADVSCYEEGLVAAGAGADFVGTTLSGYTHQPFASPYDPPDLALVDRMAEALPVPIIAEGRYNTPGLARQALVAGAHAVVVGSMITRPEVITRMFVQGIQKLVH